MTIRRRFCSSISTSVYQSKSLTEPSIQRRVSDSRPSSGIVIIGSNSWLKGRYTLTEPQAFLIESNRLTSAERRWQIAFAVFPWIMISGFILMPYSLVSFVERSGKLCVH